MMRWRRYSGSLRTLLAHRTRTFLALSGVSVGVAAVVAAGAIGDGAELAMRRTVEQLGTNLLIIKPLAVRRIVFRPQISGLATSLRLEDCDAIRAQPEIADVAPAVDGPVRVKYGGIAMKTTLRGTTPNFATLRRFSVETGRFFDADDMSGARRVTVLGARVARELGIEAATVGVDVRVAGIPYEVIGVLRAKGATAEGADEDNQVLVPLPTAARRVFNRTWLTMIYAGVRDPEAMNEMEHQITSLLRERRRGPAEGAPDDFAVQNTARTRGMQQELTRQVSQYAGGIAALALLIGGFGILALMVISVRERAAEIGLRMAVGAHPRDILAQFLLEATLLALGGWLTGLVLGGVATAAVGVATSWTLALPQRALVASFAMALLIGLGFGGIPARSAARIPPVQALARR